MQSALLRHWENYKNEQYSSIELFHALFDVYQNNNVEIETLEPEVRSEKF